MGAGLNENPKEVWDQMVTAEQCAANKQFGDQVISAGDEIVLASPSSETTAGSWFARELDCLGSQGYAPNEEGSAMAPRSSHSKQCCGIGSNKTSAPGFLAMPARSVIHATHQRSCAIAKLDWQARGLFGHCRRNGNEAVARKNSVTPGGPGLWRPAGPHRCNGRTFYHSDGEGNVSALTDGQVLPKSDPQGNPIDYQEWDVDQHQPGVNRGPERLVTGSDGSV